MQRFMSRLKRLRKGARFGLWASAAKNDRSDLFEKAAFKLLFKQFPEAAFESLKIAVALGANNFARSALHFIAPELMKAAGKMVISVATMTNSHDRLAFFESVLSELGFTLKDIINPSDRLTGKYKEYRPLFWAFRCNNTHALEHFLLSGIDDLEAYIDDHIMRSTCLHKASEMGMRVIAERLIQAGAKLDCMDGLNNTPLHLAVIHDQWDVAFMLVGEYHADLKIKNYKNKTVIDCVQDEKMKEKLLLLSNPGIKTTSTNQSPLRSLYSSSIGFLASGERVINSDIETSKGAAKNCP